MYLSTDTRHYLATICDNCRRNVCWRCTVPDGVPDGGVKQWCTACFARLSPLQQKEMRLWRAVARARSMLACSANGVQHGTAYINFPYNVSLSYWGVNGDLDKPSRETGNFANIMTDTMRALVQKLDADPGSGVSWAWASGASVDMFSTGAYDVCSGLPPHLQILYTLIEYGIYGGAMDLSALVPWSTPHSCYLCGRQRGRMYQCVADGCADAPRDELVCDACVITNWNEFAGTGHDIMCLHCYTKLPLVEQLNWRFYTMYSMMCCTGPADRSNRIPWDDWKRLNALLAAANMSYRDLFVFKRPVMLAALGASVVGTFEDTGTIASSAWMLRHLQRLGLNLNTIVVSDGALNDCVPFNVSDVFRIATDGPSLADRRIRYTHTDADVECTIPDILKNTACMHMVLCYNIVRGTVLSIDEMGAWGTDLDAQQWLRAKWERRAAIRHDTTTASEFCARFVPHSTWLNYVIRHP
jgi:hypothetical protein